jgi:probable HAF family extracellular repeat protein
MSTGCCIDALLRTIKRSIPVTLVVFTFVAVAAAQTPTYLNLPVPPDTFSVAFGVNSLGQVVGAYAVRGGGEQLFVWRNGVTTLIGTPIVTPNVLLWAAINNRGQVAYTIDRPITSYLWDNGEITTLGNFVVSAINDNTVVAGCQEKLLQNSGSRESVIWNDGTDLLKPQGGQSPFSCAFGINNSGQVVGTFYDFQGRPVSDGYLWDQGNTTLIGSLGGSYTMATGVNDSGQVVGSATTGDGTVEAFVWQNGVIQPLGFPAGETFSAAVRIDNAGRILGGGSFPWVWQNGVFTQLQTGTCSGATCAIPFGTDIVDTGAGAIAVGNCSNTVSSAKLAACLWDLPAAAAKQK